jgi:hypothetical protein
VTGGVTGGVGVVVGGVVLPGLLPPSAPPQADSAITSGRIKLASASLARSRGDFKQVFMWPRLPAFF